MFHTKTWKVKCVLGSHTHTLIQKLPCMLCAIHVHEHVPTLLMQNRYVPYEPHLLVNPKPQLCLWDTLILQWGTCNVPCEPHPPVFQKVHSSSMLPIIRLRPWPESGSTWGSHIREMIWWKSSFCRQRQMSLLQKPDGKGGRRNMRRRISPVRLTLMLAETVLFIAVGM